MTVSDDVQKARDQYAIARAAKAGTATNCPVCNVLLIKATYQQVFCSNEGAGNCKDHYWNLLAERNPLTLKRGKSVHDRMLLQLGKAEKLISAAIKEARGADGDQGNRIQQLQLLRGAVKGVLNEPV